jgi:hypothetical protein
VEDDDDGEHDDEGQGANQAGNGVVPDLPDDSIHSFEGHSGVLLFVPSLFCGAICALDWWQLRRKATTTLRLLCVNGAAEVLAVAWNPVHPDLVATGGQDDKAFVWRVSHPMRHSALLLHIRLGA